MAGVGATEGTPLECRTAVLACDCTRKLGGGTRAYKRLFCLDHGWQEVVVIRGVPVPAALKRKQDKADQRKARRRIWVLQLECRCMVAAKGNDLPKQALCDEHDWQPVIKTRTTYLAETRTLPEDQDPVQ